MLSSIKDKYLRYRLKKSDNDLSKEISLLKQYISLLDKKNLTYSKLINAYLYFILANRDIYYLAELYHFEKNVNRKNLYARLICQTTIELLEDANALLGKNLQKELGENDLVQFVDDIKGLNKIYSKLKKEYNNQLREIRNNASAHKNKEIRILLEMYDKVEQINITELTSKISLVHKYFMDVILVKIFNYKSEKEDTNI